MSRLVWDVGRADPRGSERIPGGDGEREGGVKVELKPRTGRTEGLGIRGFLAFPGRIRTRGGPFGSFLGRRRPPSTHPGFKLRFKKHTKIQKCNLEHEAGF